MIPSQSAIKRYLAVVNSALQGVRISGAEMLSRGTLLCRAILLTACSVAVGMAGAPVPVSAQNEQNSSPQFLIQEFNIDFSAQRNLWDETLKSIDTDEFKAAASSVASYYGVPSQETATSIAALGVAARGRSDAGEEHRAIFTAPDGYTTCRVELINYSPKFQSGPSDVTFNVRIKRSCHPKEDNFGYYIVAPLSWAGTRVAARVRATYVLADPPTVVRLTNEGKCMRNNFCAWLCRNDSCQKDVSDCVAADQTRDRWLSHQQDSDCQEP